MPRSVITAVYSTIPRLTAILLAAGIMLSLLVPDDAQAHHADELLALAGKNLASAQAALEQGDKPAARTLTAKAGDFLERARRLEPHIVTDSKQEALYQDLVKLLSPPDK